MSEKKEHSTDMNKDYIVEDKDNIIVRVSGQGQFKVNRETLDRINHIDNSIVSLFENIDTDVDDNSIKSNQKELKEKIIEIINLIKTNGMSLDDKEIIQSQIMIPNPDISIDKAKMIFRGEGIIDDF
jgi:hypothetical protein